MADTTDDDALVEAMAAKIWRETYRHDTLLEWHELRRGQMHHKRTITAARAAFAVAVPVIREQYVEALKPFAGAATHWDGEPYPGATEDREMNPPYWKDDEVLYEPTVDMITIGDLRRARAAIRAQEGE